MNTRKSFCLLLSVCVSLLVLFSAVSPVKARAVDLPSGGRFLTQQETLQFIGNQIPVTYFDGSDYQETYATYNTAITGNNGSAEYSTSPVGYVVDLQSPRVWLEYTIPAVAANNNSSYTTFHLQPTYSIFDTTYVYTAFAMTYGSNAPSSAVYNAPRSDWYIGGTIHHYENTATYSGNSENYARVKVNGSINAVYVPISFSSQSTFSAYAVDCSFYGTGGSGTRSFYVMCPYISYSASGASGTFDTSVSQTGGTTGSGDINVNVDMTETNGLLGRIEIILSGIVDGIKGLFVPDDDFISDWVVDMKVLLEDHLGGLYQAVTLSVNFWNQFQEVTVKQSIDIPACSVPLAGSTFTLGPYSVPLKVSGLPSVLYDGIAYIIDFLAVMAFIKMCRNKLEIFLNPDSEVVQSDN